MQRKYRKPRSVILPIFVLAGIACAVIIMLIYSNGVRYIQTELGDKFFGFLNKNNEVIRGKIWRSDNETANVEEAKYFTAVYNPIMSGENGTENLLSGADIPSDSSFTDIAGKINEILNEANRCGNPVGNFLLNGESGEYYYVRETIADFIIKNESAQNFISEARFLLADGTSWKLVTEKDSISSYKDFKVVKDGGDSASFNGTLTDFLSGQEIRNGYINFDNALNLAIYRQRGAYRLDINESKDKKEIYIGQIDHDFRKDGTGIFFFSTGDVYFGDFVKDERTGQCSFRTNYGDYYSGGIEEGKKSGEGYYIWNDGTEYEGGFSDNMKNGFGKYKYISGESYEGDYLNDVKHGKGVYTWANGDVYTGDFQNDARTGKGIYIWANGEMYEGDFKDNELHGFGKYSWPSGRPSYEGPFNKGKMTLEMPEE